MRAVVESAINTEIKDLVAVDFFGDWDLNKICPRVELVDEHKRNFLSIFSDYPSDKILYASVLENHVDILKTVEDRILGNKSKVIELLRPGKRWWGLASYLGIRIPEVSLDEPLNGNWLQKPFKSGGGRKISFWTKGMKIKKGFYLQKFLKGENLSFLFNANGKDFVLLGVTKQLIGVKELGGKDFKWCGNIYPFDISKGLKEEVEEWIYKILTKVEFYGVGGIDVIISDGKPYLIEINPRYTGSMELVERATGNSIVGMHLSACKGELTKVNMDFKGYFGKGIIYAERNLKGFLSEKIWNNGFKDIPWENEVIKVGRPICSVFTTGKDLKDVFNKLAKGKHWLYERGLKSEEV